MRRRITVIALLLAAGICPAAAATTGYTAIAVTEQTSTGYAELLLPGATIGQARDALADYAASINPQRQELYYLKVQRTEDAHRYVCRARWYRDADSYRRHGDGTKSPTSWPYLAVNCPTKG